MELRLDDLLAEFVTEASESLSELDLAVVRLERAPDDQPTLSLIFRLVHTIKGTCGFLGLPRLERVAHASETVLDRLRNGSLTVSSEGIGLILSAIDRIRLIIDTLSRTDAEPVGDDAALIAELDALAEGRTPPAPVAPSASIPLPSPTLALESAARPVPDAAAVASAPAPAPDHPDSQAVTRGQTIRVSVDVLETLMTLVSELVLTRNQFLQQLRSSGDTELTGPVQRLSHLTTELQEGVMKTRMQPIGNVWNMLPRQVRDLAHDLGKRVDLVMHGAETELDRQVLELIKDPLTHMIRNSADHGLETPAERERAGKPATGTITLSARHEGGHVVIEIEDDGRGIDVRRIAEKALSQGLATRAQLDAMSEQDIRRFIFQPGFSTAAAVTSVSGRGVGMDVVKTNIEQIGGLIELHSVLGEGSRFLVKIPLTLAIISALIVGAAGERFAIPQASVIEVVLPGTQSDTRMEMIDGAAVLRLRESLLPLIRLSTLLQLPGQASASSAPATDMVAVIGVGSIRLGLIVDGVFDTEEIVVKPVAQVLRHIPLFGGNTILEDGAVIMILDPTGIARHAGLDASRKETARAAQEEDAAVCARIDMLLVRAGTGAPKALPLSLISRLETFATERLEVSGGRVVAQYRSELMPVVALDEAVDMADLALRADKGAIHPVLVFDNGGKPVGLMVEKILDVVNIELHVDLGTDRQGVLGTAIIAGCATDIVDPAFWLTRASGNWFRNQPTAARKRRLLVVDDSSFFRQLLAPSLSAAGYEVTVAESAERALAMREAGRTFDAIISDLEMPGLGGLGFARKIRAGGGWSDLPLLALTASDAAQEARAAGFTDTIRKFERETLLLSLEQCLALPVAA